MCAIAGNGPYADRVARLEACLVDAYDTIVTCDFSVLRREVPTLAGIPAGIWDTEYSRLGALLTDGRMSKTEAFGQILQASGQQAHPGLVAEMVRRDAELLLANARLYDDVIPFLREAPGPRHQDRGRQQLHREHPPVAGVARGGRARRRPGPVV